MTRTSFSFKVRRGRLSPSSSVPSGSGRHSPNKSLKSLLTIRLRSKMTVLPLATVLLYRSAERKSIAIALDSFLYHQEKLLVILGMLQAIFQQFQRFQRIETGQQTPQFDDLLECLVVVEKFI